MSYNKRERERKRENRKTNILEKFNDFISAELIIY